MRESREINLLGINKKLKKQIKKQTKEVHCRIAPFS